ncbi:hypothetical protein B0H17DRAFT_1326225 [Mycena rosella]|uniref:Uncharacterized protein n=1 Tax=Mycena rosella TaxID=1033263 RepID=A0AAD7M8F3_MYCRO|nr:hypothetical protein B0H17DRAFT_1326225 [Mycena rosella]
MPPKKTSAPTDAGIFSSYSSLSSLGAPITLEDYTRIYKGPLADALQFLAEHVVGRQAAANARASLFLAQEERAKSNLKQPDTTRSSGDKAVARLSSAKKSSTLYTSQLGDAEAKAHATRAQADGLQKKLDEKRRLLLLLQVLEAKQSLRTKRIEEMTRMIEDLRRENCQCWPVSEMGNRRPPMPSLVSTHFQITPFQNPPEMKPTEALSSRVSNTRDAVAGLHNYTIRLSRFLKSPAPGEGTFRLQRAIARRLGPGHPETAQALDQCILYARTLADQKLQPNLQTQSANIRELEAKTHSNQEKAQKLQKLADLSTALRLLCEHHVSSIADFTENASHPLRRSLQEESRLSKDHVDISRAAIASDNRLAKLSENPLSFLTLVTQACRMQGSVGARAILAEVERIIRHAHRRASLLDAGRLPRPAGVDPSLIDEYRSTTDAAHDRATKLLTRKAEKAVMGRSLASDVEALLRESRVALGLPTM